MEKKNLEKIQQGPPHSSDPAVDRCHHEALGAGGVERTHMIWSVNPGNEGRGKGAVSGRCSGPRSGLHPCTERNARHTPR